MAFWRLVGGCNCLRGTWTCGRAESSTEMESRGLRHAVVVIVVLCLLLTSKGTEGFRFSFVKEESFTQEVKNDGDTVYVSFVVIKNSESSYSHGDAVDLIIRGPSGELIQDVRGKTSEKFSFVAQKKGLYKFQLLTASSNEVETMDFDVTVSHHESYSGHAEDAHLTPLLQEVANLEEELARIRYLQHFLWSLLDRQEIINDGINRRAIHKSMFETAALVGASILQVYLLKRLFERKYGTSRL